LDLTDHILEQALKHFDAAGVAVEKTVDGFVLILGLSTTQERDLDEGYFEGERLDFRGWLKHVKPRIKSLMDIFQEKGFEAEPMGWWGYPMSFGKKEVMHLKSLAVMAGFGQQGKNTLIIHPQFGPWWRLAAIRTNAPLTPTGPGIYEHTENPYCISCQACIEACPIDGLLEPYRLLDRTRCLANISSEPVSGKIKWCDRCIAVCPVGSY